MVGASSEGLTSQSNHNQRLDGWNLGNSPVQAYSPKSILLTFYKVYLRNLDNGVPSGEDPKLHFAVRELP